jgi:eukaryotic-like serine/threonine-protein kinase
MTLSRRDEASVQNALSETADHSNDLQPKETVGVLALGLETADLGFHLTDALEDSTGPIAFESPQGFPFVAGYEVLGVLGRGGMGIVYQARQTGLKRLVALKMILAGAHADSGELARFQAEAEAVARLHHPNIVQVYETGEVGGNPFLSLEYVDGGSLAQRLRGAPQEPRLAAELTSVLADALEAAHRRGIVHRDLKPANILLTPDGVPKVADFGLAKDLDAQSGRTQTGSILGTPSYMAPEQAWGRIHAIGPCTDVYALGAMLYEMLTGRPPFRGTTVVETLELVKQQEPVSPATLQPRIPRDLETICLKCLSKEVAARYPSAQALSDDVRRFLRGEPITARAISSFERAWRWCRRNPLVASLVASTAAALVLGTVVSISLAILATGRANAITKINGELVTARDTANRSANAANKSAIDADEQSQLTLKMLESVIYKIQGELSEIPAAQGVRGSILKEASAGLSQLSDRLRERPRIDRVTAETTLSLAEVFRQVGDGKGAKGPAAAVPLYARAVDLFEKLLEASKDSGAARRDLAKACLLAAVNLTRADANPWDGNAKRAKTEPERPMLIESRRLNERAVQLRRQDFEQDPSSRDAAFFLAQALSEWSWLESRMSTPERARPLLEEAYQILHARADSLPDDVSWQSQAGTTAERLGDWYFDVKEDYARADSLYQESLKIAGKLSAAHPEDESLRMNLANAWFRVGDVRDKRGDKMGTLEAFQNECKTTLPMEVTAKGNLQTLLDVSISYDHLSRINTDLKRWDEVIRVVRRGFEIRIPLLAADPTNRRVHSLLSRPTERLGLAYRSLGQNEKAVEAYEFSLAHVAGYAQRTGDHSIDEQFNGIRTALAECKAELSARASNPKTTERKP